MPGRKEEWERKQMMEVHPGPDRALQGAGRVLARRSAARAFAKRAMGWRPPGMCVCVG